MTGQVLGALPWLAISASVIGVVTYRVIKDRRDAKKHATQQDIDLSKFRRELRDLSRPVQTMTDEGFHPGEDQP